MMMSLLKVFHAKVIAMCETTSLTWVTILLKLENQKEIITSSYLGATNRLSDNDVAIENALSEPIIM